MTGRIAVEEVAGGAWIRLDNPARRNAIGLAMWDALTESFQRLADDGARFVVLASAVPDMFGSGADLNDLETALVDPVAYEERIGRAHDALAAFPGVSIAAIDGACFGGALALASGAGAAGGELASTARCASAQARSALLCYVNFARAANGAGLLRQASTLGSAARAKGGAIVRCGDFSHGPCGSDPTAAVRSSGYGFRLWGENLYWGSGPLGSARNAVGGWLRSPAHRRRFRTP